MVKNYKRNDFVELVDFFKKYNLKSISANANLVSDLKKIHKAVYPLLIWNAELKKQKISISNVKSSEEFHRYFAESVSDIIQSTFLVVQGLYKPANQTLRSGIENYIRAVGAFNGIDVSSIKNTYELFDEVKKCNTIIATDGMVKSQFSAVHSSYAELCNYVHTSGKQYMSLLGALNAFPKYGKTKANDYVRELKKISKFMNFSMLYVVGNDFHDKFHHLQADMILDELTKAEKSSFMGRI